MWGLLVGTGTYPDVKRISEGGFVSSSAGITVFLKSFKYGTVQNILPMAMSKKDMTRRSSKKRAMLENLEKQAASGSGEAKKKLAKAKKKMK